MILKDFIPTKEVQEFVQLYRIVHLQFDANAVIPYKAYPPRPEHCLAFYPFSTETVKYNNSNKEVKDLKVVLYGQFNEVTNRIIGYNFLVFQIIFYPGALYKLTGIPATAFTNEYLNAELIFSRKIHEVNEQLYHATSYQQMIDVVNLFVVSLIKKQAKNSLPIDDAFILLLKADSTLTIEYLAKEACLSLKQFERKFKERSGINPKLYERIIQFDKAFRLKNSNPEYDWLKIAIECNYYDYQHLSKAYKDFTNLTPTNFHLIEDKAPERNFGLVEGYY